MHCYCLQQFIKSQFKIINLNFSQTIDQSNYQQFRNLTKEELGKGKFYCKDWFEMYSLANAFVYMVAAGIAILNISVKSLLRCKKTLILLIHIIQAYQNVSQLIQRPLRSFQVWPKCSLCNTLTQLLSFFLSTLNQILEQTGSQSLKASTMSLPVNGTDSSDPLS